LSGTPFGTFGGSGDATASGFFAGLAATFSGVSTFEVGPFGRSDVGGAGSGAVAAGEIAAGSG